YGYIFSPDSKKLLVWGLPSDCSSFESWDIDSSKLQWNVRIANAATEDMFFQPASNNLISNTALGIVSIPLDTIALEKYSILCGPAFNGETEESYSNVTVSEDGKYIACNLYFSGGFTVLSLPPVTNSSVKYLPTNGNSNLSLFPNPSSGILSVRFDAQKAVSSDLGIYDLLGREVKTQKLPAGINTIDLDLGDLPSGSYIIRVASEGKTDTQKFSLIKN
ncbi:MAG: T9SS type A sorting domain-containing protein, partial [Candidatus Kapaibacterium sp.]